MPDFKIVRDGRVIGYMQSKDKESAKAFYAKTSQMLEDEFDAELDDGESTIEDDSFGETIN